MPVLLLHGLASTRRFWNLVVPDLVAAGLSVVALDQRGHGESPVPSDVPFGPEAVARDALTALDALGISRAVVVGHSWGGTIALTLAADQPGRVLAAVAIDGGFAVRPPDTDLVELRERLTPPTWSMPPDELTAMLARGQLAPYWDDERARALLPLFGVGPDGRARSRLPLDQHLAILDGMLGSDVEQTLQSVRCPAWLVSCEPAGSMADGADEWSQQKADGLAIAAATLPNARTMRWSGALHDVPLQWPALVSGLIRSAAQSTTGTDPDRREETP